MSKISKAEYRALLAADRAANANYPKSRFVLHWFRLCQHWRGARGPLGRIIYLALSGTYKLASEWLLGIELPPSTPVGPGLRLRHGVGLVVNPASAIGSNVMLRHGVTLGNRREIRDCPTIGDNVEIGVGAVIIGSISIGNGARIGPNAVVFVDVPDGAVVYSPVPTIRTDAAG